MRPPAPTFALHADLSPTRKAHNRNSLFVRALDKSNAPKAGAAIRLIVTGGTADSPDAVTDPDGGVTVGITWNQARGGSVQILSPGLAPLVLVQPGTVEASLARTGLPSPPGNPTQRFLTIKINPKKTIYYDTTNSNNGNRSR